MRAEHDMPTKTSAENQTEAAVELLRLRANTPPSGLDNEIHCKSKIHFRAESGTDYLRGTATVSLWDALQGRHLQMNCDHLFLLFIVF